MKVNDPNTRGVSATGTGKVLEVETVGRSTGTNASGQPKTEDQVQLSRLSEHLRASDQQAPARIAFVDQLQAAVANGSYAIDDSSVSRGIIEDALRAGVDDGTIATSSR